jgi:DUF1680 family protein
MRGISERGSDQSQNRTPFREAEEAVGHAVLANYLYAGVADLYAETGEEALLNALEKLWHDVTQKKMYITGATGALHKSISLSGDKVGEAYGRAYQLPNSSAYNETCANIGNGMWNWRMLSLTGEARFADVMELVFYNSGISGIGLSGKDFYYTNVLRWNGEDHELLTNDAPQRWDLPRGGICCPPNVVRTVAEMCNYAYSLSDAGLWVHLYGGNHLDTELPDGSEIELSQETDYPWGGDIKIRVQKTPGREWSLFLRIPGWATGSSIKVNQKVIDQDLEAGEFCQVKRKWSKGDVVQLHLPMEARLMEANPLVEETRNQVAVMRGPLVYCLESVDLSEEVKLAEIKIPDDIRLIPRHDKDLLGGVTVLEGDALRLKGSDWSGRLYRPYDAAEPEGISIRMIPYYAWSNRGPCDMSVWLPLAFSK